MSPPPVSDHPLLSNPAATNSLVLRSQQAVTMDSAPSLTTTAGNSSTGPLSAGSSVPDPTIPQALAAADPSTRRYSRIVPIYEPTSPAPASPRPSSAVPNSSLSSTDAATALSVPNHFRFLSLPAHIRLQIYTCLQTDKGGW